MKTNHYVKLFLSLCLGSGMPTRAQQFDSGSDGSMGALSPTANTNLVVPPDGVFHFTSINIPVSVGVGFIANSRNTPVYILAQTNVVISGWIEVSGNSANESLPGRGGPGAFDGGFGSIQNYPASDGQGPGAGIVNGYRGAAFAFAQGSNSNIYGNTLLVPLIGGSGGAGSPGTSAIGYGGGGGGGAITIASSSRITLINNGNYNIYARGGRGTAITGDSRDAGGGSGGSIRLVARLVDGDGSLDASGGGPTIHRGSPGRIRIDTQNRFDWRGINVASSGAKWSVGSQMYVFPHNNPRLDVIEAAGIPILEGTNGVVSIALSPGASTNQTIKIKATGFTNDIPITVSVVPEAGASARYDGVITVPNGNPVVGSVNVIIPIDSFCNIRVWTR